MLKSIWLRYELIQSAHVLSRKTGERYATFASKPKTPKNALLCAGKLPNKGWPLWQWRFGLDTPASTVNLLNALECAWLSHSDIPNTGNALIEKCYWVP